LTDNFAHSMGQKIYASSKAILEEIKNNLGNSVGNIDVEPINSSNKLKLYKVKIEINYLPCLKRIVEYLNKKNEYPFSHLEIINGTEKNENREIYKNVQDETIWNEISELNEAFNMIKSKGLKNLIVFGFEIE